MNYYDILFARKMAGGQGEITTEGLSVTENGTYTAPEGKAYTPVVVNVPTPEDSYQLKSLPAGAISTITDGSNLPMPSLKVGIEPIQEGSGDPSPENVRPISGHTEANVTVSPTTDAEDGTTYTIQFKDGSNPLTVYGGTLDVVSGVLTVDRAIRLVSECTWQGNNGVFYTNSVASSIKHGDGRFDHVISSAYKTENVGGVSSLTDGGISVDADGYIQLKDLRYSTASDFKTNMGTTQLVYELATPQTYQLTPTMVKSLLGTNNIWADTGDVLEGSYFKEL